MSQQAKKEQETIVTIREKIQNGKSLILSNGITVSVPEQKQQKNFFELNKENKLVEQDLGSASISFYKLAVKKEDIKKFYELRKAMFSTAEDTFLVPLPFDEETQTFQFANISLLFLVKLANGTAPALTKTTTPTLAGSTPPGSSTTETAHGGDSKGLATKGPPKKPSPPASPRLGLEKHAHNVEIYLEDNKKPNFLRLRDGKIETEIKIISYQKQEYVEETPTLYSLHINDADLPIFKQLVEHYHVEKDFYTSESQNPESIKLEYSSGTGVMKGVYLIENVPLKLIAKVTEGMAGTMELYAQQKEKRQEEQRRVLAVLEKESPLIFTSKTGDEKVTKVTVPQYLKQAEKCTKEGNHIGRESLLEGEHLYKLTVKTDKDAETLRTILAGTSFIEYPEGMEGTKSHQVIFENISWETIAEFTNVSSVASPPSPKATGLAQLGVFADSVAESVMAVPASNKMMIGAALFIVASAPLIIGAATDVVSDTAKQVSVILDLALLLAFILWISRDVMKVLMPDNPAPQPADESPSVGR